MLRLALLGIVMAALVWSLLQDGYYYVSLLTAALLLLTALELWGFVARTNRELSRFLDAARYADFSQRFSLQEAGSGFGELGDTLNEILQKLWHERAEQETDVRNLKALIEHVPIPLLTLHADESISLRNNAARRLFGNVSVTRLSDLRQFGKGFHDAVAESVPGRRELVVFDVENIEYRLTLAVSEVINEGEPSRLISLQDIQSELDETQAEAWQDLVRVLTHEIINSITPITSLAKSAADVVDDVIDGVPEDARVADDLADLRDAVATVARRSDGLVQFVDSYRQLTRLAPPEKKRVLLHELFDEISRLANAEFPGQQFLLVVSVEPEGLDVFADRDLLEPVLLNLIRNAAQATADQADARIELRGRLNRRGHVVLEVVDNGPGIPEELHRRIFVPFFTTKDQGSGVGLALARQVMIAHGGFIRLATTNVSGAHFTLTF